MNEDQVAKIQTELKDHKVIYVGKEHGFMLSVGGDIFITAALQSNLDKTLRDSEHRQTEVHRRNSSYYCNAFQEGFNIYWQPCQCISLETLPAT